MDEKSAATNALGVYAEACPTGFMPYLEPSCDVLKTMADYFHEEVRGSAFESLQRLTLAVHKASSPVTNELLASSSHNGSHASSSASGSSSTALSASAVVLSPQAKQLCSTVVKMLLQAINEDPEKAAVTAATASLAVLIQQLGQQALQDEQQLLAVVNVAASILGGNALCQVWPGHAVSVVAPQLMFLLQKQWVPVLQGIKSVSCMSAFCCVWPASNHTD